MIAEEALDSGVRLFQYRDKKESRRARFEVAGRLARLTRSRKACLIVNDEVDVAMAAGADGVHLGEDDFPYEKARSILGDDYLIGLSTHSPEEAVDSQQKGADYIGFGPVFPSATKRDRKAVGIEGLRKVTGAVSLPVFAIGGIYPENALSVMEAGAYGFAVIHGVLGTPDIGAAVRSYPFNR
jgi:thiamine-phosphate pyrophosphorylase